MFGPGGGKQWRGVTVTCTTHFNICTSATAAHNIAALLLQVNVDRDLPMAGKEVSENEDAAMDDGSMEVGTPPDQPVHDMSPKIICPE